MVVLREEWEGVVGGLDMIDLLALRFVRLRWLMSWVSMYVMMFVSSILYCGMISRVRFKPRNTITA